MSRRELVRRYFVFLAGVVFTALGISLITKSGLGTSAVTSFAYVLTFLSPGVTLGTFTFIVNCVMLLGQALLLGRRFKLTQILQLPATFLFSLCIDLWCRLLSLWTPTLYVQRWLPLLAGCVILGLGVALQITADVLALPCEGFVKTVTQKFQLEFGKVKTCFDVLMVTAAVVLSLIGLGHIAGLREGTVVAALTVGSLSRFFRARLGFLVKVPAAKEEEKLPLLDGAEALG